MVNNVPYTKILDIAQAINLLTSITIRIFRNEDRIAIYRSDPDLDDSIDSFGPFISRLMASSDPTGCITTANQFVFGFVKHEEFSLVLGPVKGSPSSCTVLEKVADTIDPSHKKKSQIIRHLESCPNLSIYSMLPLVMQAKALLDYRISSENDVLHGLMDSTVSNIAIYNYNRDGYSVRRQATERVLIELIEQGRASNVKEWFVITPSMIANIGVTDNALRNFRDHFIMLSTIYAQAAMRGGLDRLAASDILFRSISAAEKISTLNELNQLQANLAVELTRKVAQAIELKPYSQVVSDTMSYIYRNIYNKILTEDIAESLLISRGFLSKTFHKETGTTLNDFIIRMKVDEASHLLENPSLTISAISDMLAFSSQSYFTRVFKELTGKTPKQFRSDRTGR